MLAPLHHLVYQSSATTTLDEADLEELLSESRAWNTAHGLTGILLYSDGSIMQVLEGTKEEVEYIFARIATDYRHANVVKLSDGPVQERSFADWSMGFKVVHTNDFATLRGYVNPVESARLASPSPQADPGLRALLASFVAEDTIRL